MLATRRIACWQLWKGCTRYTASTDRAAVAARTFSTTPTFYLNHFQKQKILGEFTTLYDRNKDGYVDAKDIEQYKSTLQNYYTHRRGEYMHTPLSAYEDYWILFKDIADANKDGRLSQEEWLDIWTRISDNTEDVSFYSLPQWVRLMPPVIFPIIDYKDDGIIDEEEYKTFWYEVGGISASSELTNKCMTTMTEDSKYELNQDRFEKLYADFYLSKDVSTPGKYMAGPMEYQDDDSKCS